MPVKRKATKRSAKPKLNLNGQVMFIGGQAYQLKKMTKKELEKAGADTSGPIFTFDWDPRRSKDKPGQG